MRARTMWLAAWILAGCASKRAYQAPPPPPPLPDPVAQGELPPHRFFARPPTGNAYPVAERVAFDTLPKLVQSQRCTDAGAVAEGRPQRPTGPSKAKKTKGTTLGHVPYAGGASTATAAPSVPADDASVSKTAEAEARVDADGGDVASGAGMAPEPGASPPPATNVQVAGGSTKDRRNDRRERRVAKRSQALASAPAAESAADLAMEMPATPAIAEPILAWPPPEEGWGAATYLSNDDSMSLSSAQRVLFAIDEHLPLPPQHVRPHELLNYFSFQTSAVPEGHDFSVRAEIAPSRVEPGLYTLGLAVAGRPVGRQGRRNVALTLVVDRSGSMKEEGRMDFLKRGLLRMVRELEDGDVVHVVTFDHRVCNPLRNFVVGRDDLSVLTRTIHAIEPSGRTNLHAGLELGYQLADASYQPKHSNRVVVITDALANTGVTNAATMGMVSDWYDARRIRLSGVGVGRDFDDALLDRLTEKGRGAYVFLGSEAEVDAVFGERFTSLVETVANDVHFRLHLPPSLRMQAFHGEEASTSKQEVQAVHFFADTSQLLLADLEAWDGHLRPQDDVMLEIEYQHPESGQTLVEDHVFTLGAIGAEAGPEVEADNVRKAEVITTFVQGIERQAARGTPARWQPRPGTWLDPDALEDCASTRAQLRELAADSRDPEVTRVLSLWDGYCTRFEGSAAGRPGRKTEPPKPAWPGATH
jgi:Ca-activated chloride channel family protein